MLSTVILKVPPSSSATFLYASAAPGKSLVERHSSLSAVRAVEEIKRDCQICNVLRAESTRPLLGYADPLILPGWLARVQSANGALCMSDEYTGMKCADGERGRACPMPVLSLRVLTGGALRQVHCCLSGARVGSCLHVETLSRYSVE